MKVKAKISFTGIVSMYKGEVKDIGDAIALDDLLSANYVERVNTNESKRSDSGNGKRVSKK